MRMTRPQALAYCAMKQEEALLNTEDDGHSSHVWKGCQISIEKYGVDGAEARLWKEINVQNYSQLDARSQRASDIIEQFLLDIHDEKLIKRMVAREMGARASDIMADPETPASQRAYLACLQHALKRVEQGNIPLEYCPRRAREELASILAEYEQGCSDEIRQRLFMQSVQQEK